MRRNHSQGPGGKASLLLALALVITASPGVLSAQSVSGTVRDQGTGDPVAAAQVFIEGLNLGALTQSNGTYTLADVPAGTHTLSVQFLGYRSESVSVTVAAGQNVVQNFFLSQQALQLDELVVTGTAAASRVREIGNSVAVLDAGVAEVQPINNVSDLLRGRLPGVVVQQGSGDVGTASTIKIRGSSTMRRVNDGPLVYIDGVRVSNRMESGGRDVSRIDDLDPAMIETIEVIKGPAAATLYGTEAANGVINIRTKGGGVGAAQWNFTTRQGSQWFHDPAGHTPTNWGVNPNTGQIESLNILENQAESDLMFRYGRTQYYGIDVSGGTDTFQYFIGGSAGGRPGRHREQLGQEVQRTDQPQGTARGRCRDIRQRRFRSRTPQDPQRLSVRRGGLRRPDPPGVRRRAPRLPQGDPGIADREGLRPERRESHERRAYRQAHALRLVHAPAHLRARRDRRPGKLSGQLPEPGIGRNSTRPTRRWAEDPRTASRSSTAPSTTRRPGHGTFPKTFFPLPPLASRSTPGPSKTSPPAAHAFRPPACPA